MTREELKARIVAGINDDPDSPVFFTDTQLNELIDEAAEFLVGEIKCVRRTVLVPQREGTIFYSTRSVADDMLFPYRIWNHSRGQRLTVSDFMSLDNFHERWMTVTGDPQIWFAASWDLFGVWPSTVDAGGVLRVDYLAWPRALQDDSDQLEMLEACNEAVMLYGQYMGALKQWDALAAQSKLQELQKQSILEKAKSGILRVSTRSFNRNPNLNLPSNLRTEPVR